MENSTIPNAQTQEMTVLLSRFDADIATLKRVSTDVVCEASWSRWTCEADDAGISERKQQSRHKLKTIYQSCVSSGDTAADANDESQQQSLSRVYQLLVRVVDDDAICEEFRKAHQIQRRRQRVAERLEKRNAVLKQKRKLRKEAASGKSKDEVVAKRSAAVFGAGTVCGRTVTACIDGCRDGWGLFVHFWCGGHRLRAVILAQHIDAQITAGSISQVGTHNESPSVGTNAVDDDVDDNESSDFEPDFSGDAPAESSESSDSESDARSDESDGDLASEGEAGGLFAFESDGWSIGADDENQHSDSSDDVEESSNVRSVAPTLSSATASTTSTAPPKSASHRAPPLSSRFKRGDLVTATVLRLSRWQKRCWLSLRATDFKELPSRPGQTLVPQCFRYCHEFESSSQSVSTFIGTSTGGSSKMDFRRPPQSFEDLLKRLDIMFACLPIPAHYGDGAKRAKLPKNRVGQRQRRKVLELLYGTQSTGDKDG